MIKNNSSIDVADTDNSKITIENIKESRRSKSNYYLDIAEAVSKRSTCLRRKFGAVIVKDDEIISTGYNGFPRNIEDTEERLNNRELKYKFILHAEMNCILNALYNGRSVKDCILFVHGLPPCSECTKSIIQAGIKKVITDSKATDNWKESLKLSLEMLKEANVEIEFI